MVMICDSFERLLWGCAFTIAILCGIYFIRIARKREVFNERVIMLGLASLLFGFTFSLIFTYIQVLHFPGVFNNNIFYGSIEYIDGYIIVFGKLSYISLGIGGMVFILAFEIIIKRTKFLLTLIFTIIIILIGISESIEIARGLFNYILLIGIVITVPLILFLYTRWSHLEFRAVSSFLLFGFLLFMNSLILAHRAHKNLYTYPSIARYLPLCSSKATFLLD